VKERLGVWPVRCRDRGGRLVAKATSKGKCGEQLGPPARACEAVHCVMCLCVCVWWCEWEG